MNHSFIAVDKSTGIGVWEFWNPSIIAKINSEKYVVMTALEYLGNLNKAIAKQQEQTR